MKTFVALSFVTLALIAISFAAEPIVRGKVAIGSHEYTNVKITLENRITAKLTHDSGSARVPVIDLDVIVGEQGKKCRLVAMRAAPEVTAARRAQRRKKARESGKNPCPKGLIRDAWHLMLTNLSRPQADVSQLAAIYRTR